MESATLNLQAGLLPVEVAVGMWGTMLADIASAGNHGRIRSNQERDVTMRTKKHLPFGLEPYPLNIVLQKPGDLMPKPYILPVFAPHELFAALWAAGEQQQNLSLFGPGGREGVAEWWRHACELPEYAEHPATA